MKKFVCCALCLFLTAALCGCGRYYKTNTFSFLDDFEHLAVDLRRTDDIFTRDRDTFVVYQDGQARRFLLEVGANDYGTPKTVRMFFMQADAFDLASLRPTVLACLRAFTGEEEDICGNALSLILPTEDASLFSFDERTAQTETHRLSFTSTPVFCAFDFSALFPSETEQNGNYN